ncbi:MAG: HDOD domain-containing protein [Pseudomonadota bacterium]
MLYRSARTNSVVVTDGNHATAEVLTNAFLEIGIDKLVGGGIAFINITKDYLENRSNIPYTSKKVVLEILEDIEPTREIHDAVKDYKKRGYVFALDDFVYPSSQESLLNHVKIVKIDVREHTAAELQECVRRLKRYPALLLAEKVETREEYEFCKKLGFSYFQGYFLAKPQIVEGRKPPQNKVAIMQLLREMQNPNVNLNVLERHVMTDAALSYKVMKYINSPAVGLREKVDSIKAALVLMGLDALSTWVRLIAMSSLCEHGRELVRIALVRAKTCESLALAVSARNTDAFFTVGLFSVLDAMLDIPMVEVLQKLGISGEMHAALVDRAGVIGQALDCVIAFEKGKWDAITFNRLGFKKIQQCFLDGVMTADKLVAQM